MSQNPLPYPPQMRNGGPPPAHLSLSNPPILLRGCNTIGSSLLCAPPTGFSTGPVTPQTIGLVTPYAKTKRLQGCSNCHHWGGQYLPEAALTRTPPTVSSPPTGTRNRPWTNYGWMSVIANRQRPSNASLTRVLLTTAMRPIVAMRWPGRTKRWPIRPISNDRQRPRGQKRWPTRPTSNITTRRPRGQKHWPTRLTSNVAM
jgi:hypothetical protein